MEAQGSNCQRVRWKSRHHHLMFRTMQVYRWQLYNSDYQYCQQGLGVRQMSHSKSGCDDGLDDESCWLQELIDYNRAVTWYMFTFHVLKLMGMWYLLSFKVKDAEHFLSPSEIYNICMAPIVLCFLLCGHHDRTCSFAACIPGWSWHPPLTPSQGKAIATSACSASNMQPLGWEIELWDLGTAQGSAMFCGDQCRSYNRLPAT